MLAVRLVKIAMVAALALFALLVAANRLVDYQAGYTFARHILTMDTVVQGSALRGRAIADPAISTIVYWAVIAVEALTGLLLALAAIRLAVNLRAPPSRFNGAKGWVALGAGLGFLLWFVGFMGVGGEWFAMAQSRTWNGQEAAFRFYMTLLAVLIFVNQPDGEVRR